MATLTTNYSLSKPDVTDNVEIGVLNNNFDKIDTAIHTTKTIADSAKTSAGNAMPKSGGTFTGQVVAYKTNRTTIDVRNCVVCNSSGTPISTNYLIFNRK